ncbi:MAG: DUF167 domain-containing protein [Caedimonadaceae bacterium]|nr:MAG: DUF167 domain-containing protein [Caedimonadaceae bacterium]
MTHQQQSKKNSPLLLTEKHGWTIAIRLTPRASKDVIVKGICVDDKGRSYLKATVTEAPENGRANKALINLMSKEWKIPASTIKLLTGETQRLKIFSLQTVSDKLRNALEDEIN